MNPARVSVLTTALFALCVAAPGIAQAGPTDGVCSWDPAARRISVATQTTYFQASALGLPCSNTDMPNIAEVSDIDVDLTGYTNTWIEVQPQLSVRDGSGVKVFPQLAAHDGSEIKYHFTRFDAPAGANLVFKLQYDATVVAPTAPPLRVESGGLDLNADGDLDITVPDGQPFTVDITQRKQPTNINLRNLPARPDQIAYVRAYSGTARGANRFWGPRSGAHVRYRGGPRADIVTTYGGDDAIEALAGNNTIRSGAGDDDVSAWGGNDRVWGGPGSDTLWVGHGNNIVYGGTGTNDIAAGNGYDILRGGPGRDRIGDRGRLNIIAGAGSDEIDVSGVTGGTANCGTGTDYQHHKYNDAGRYVSCGNYATWFTHQVRVPIRYSWAQDTMTYLCPNGWSYRPTCPDPRRDD
jgi:hypothetical protein